MSSDQVIAQVIDLPKHSKNHRRTVGCVSAFWNTYSGQALTHFPRPQPTDSVQQRGFTLLELTIVVLLLSLFASLTIPVLSRFGRDDLAWSARRIAGTIQFLFNEAAISGREHRLTFELQQNHLSAKVVEEGGAAVNLERWEKRLILPGDVKIKDVNVAGRGLFSSGSATIHFLPSGFLEESLIHISEGQKKMTLRLNPFTGATEVREGYHDF